MDISEPPRAGAGHCACYHRIPPLCQTAGAAARAGRACLALCCRTALYLSVCVLSSYRHLRRSALHASHAPRSAAPFAPDWDTLRLQVWAFSPAAPPLHRLPHHRRGHGAPRWMTAGTAPPQTGLNDTFVFRRATPLRAHAPLPHLRAKAGGRAFALGSVAPTGLPPRLRRAVYAPYAPLVNSFQWATCGQAFLAVQRRTPTLVPPRLSTYLGRALFIISPSCKLCRTCTLYSISLRKTRIAGDNRHLFTCLPHMAPSTRFVA